MNDETQMLKREDHGGTSHFLQVSVRAWLAIGLIATVCLHSGATVYLAIVLRQPDLVKVGEPLYTMAGMALAYYFGQQKQKQ